MTDSLDATPIAKSKCLENGKNVSDNISLDDVKNVETVDIKLINNLIKLINAIEAYNRTMLKDIDNFIETIKKKLRMPLICILSRIKCVNKTLYFDMKKHDFNEA